MTTNAPKWIDTHVHLFPQGTPAEGIPTLIQQGGVVNTPENYRSGNDNQRPSGVVVVHFSKAPDSHHVIDTLDEMQSGGCRMPVAGVIKADVSLSETFEWIQRDDVKGVRVYAKEAPADFSDKAAWDRLWQLCRTKGKHVLLFGSAPHLRPTAAHIPSDLTLVIDHLGLPDATKGANDPDFQALLADMVARNQNAGAVYYKGPGYRSSLDVKKVQPFVDTVIAKLGVDRVMLGASDGPFAGPVLEQDARWAGKKLGDVVHFDWVLNYTTTLAKRSAEHLGLDEASTVEATHYGNAAHLYGWDA